MLLKVRLTDYEIKQMQRGIKYIGLAETTGYGNAAKALCRTLKEMAVPVSFCGILPGTVEKGGNIITDEFASGYDTVIIHTVPEYYPYWLKREKTKNPSVKVWGYTTWETDTLPSHWKDILNTMDGIFVPCTWNKSVFQQSDVTVPIEILPHISPYEGQEPDNLFADGKMAGILESVRDKFIFYNIGVWSERKAPELLIRAFKEEFTQNDKVCLILKTGETDWSSYKRRWYAVFRKRFGKSSHAFRRLTKGKKQTADIIHITDTVSETAIRSLHAHAHCFVSLSRGEGWGMGSYEAAWFNKPVINTGYGGVLDYLSSQNAFLVNYRLTPVKTSFGKESYSGNQTWAEADLEHARKLMRFAVEQPHLATQKGLSAGAYVRDHFNAAEIINHLIKVLHDQNS